MLRRRLSIALVAALATLPAASKQDDAPPTNLYIDVATHNMVGMPDVSAMMGGLGGLMSRHMGGGQHGQLSYPTTPHPGMTGQYLDLALHNALKPGVPVQDHIPDGLNLGNTLTLLPIERSSSPSGKSARADGTGEMSEMDITISEYWGCGAKVRPGQPKVASFKIKGGRFDMKKGMRGMNFEAVGSLSKSLYAPDRGIDLLPGYVYWPNREDGRRVPNGASLAGDHQITGDGIPASMKFQVDQAADFMPKLMLRPMGEATDAIALSWPSVTHSRAYFITGMKMKTASQHALHMVIWSSADVPGAGSSLHNYLSNSTVDKWVKQHVLLPASATSCIIPKGIFASEGGEDSMVPAMLMMSAYGPETWITYPPKPANSKLPWHPEWSVRLRAKSTATSMLGMNFGDTNPSPDDGDDSNDQESQHKRPGMGRLLQGILGG